VDGHLEHLGQVGYAGSLDHVGWVLAGSVTTGHIRRPETHLSPARAETCHREIGEPKVLPRRFVLAAVPVKNISQYPAGPLLPIPLS
jgi:hypothetical protein